MTAIGGTYGATRRPDPRVARLINDALGDARSVVNVGAGTGAYEPTDRHPLPRDCPDGLFSAYWGRPEAYLDSEVRRNISNFALAKEDDVAKGLASLRADLKSGVWDERNGHRRSLSELDLGYRLLVAELA
jgi:hypothetical protein